MVRFENPDALEEEIQALEKQLETTNGYRTREELWDAIEDLKYRLSKAYEDNRDPYTWEL